MKTSDNKKRSDYLLLHTVIGKYLESMDGAEAVSRYLQLENIEEIIAPFYELKQLIQRVEWLQGEEYARELINFLIDNRMSAEELGWAIDMFALQKQYVMDKIGKSV